MEWVLSQNVRWLVEGDWNMVLYLEDNSWTDGRVACNAEKLAFTSLIAHLQVEDKFPSNTLLCYTWDNKRCVGVRTMKQLDRVHTFYNPASVQPTNITEYTILGDCVLLDHLLVSFSLELVADTLTRSRYKMNSAYL